MLLPVKGPSEARPFACFEPWSPRAFQGQGQIRVQKAARGKQLWFNQAVSLNNPCCVLLDQNYWRWILLPSLYSPSVLWADCMRTRGDESTHASMSTRHLHLMLCSGFWTKAVASSELIVGTTPKTAARRSSVSIFLERWDSASRTSPHLLRSKAL